MKDKKKKAAKDKALSLNNRRDFLKAGAAIAAAPILSGLAASVIPSEAEAAASAPTPSEKSKKILIISASPRIDSNSDALSTEFMRGAVKSGHFVEKIRLAEKNIHDCLGCCSCIWKPGACVQQDDMTDIMQKMIAADVLVLASPVYFLSFNGKMKTFIDRVCPVYTQLNGKEVYYIASAAGGRHSIDMIEQSFKVFTGCLSGTIEKGTVAITGVWEGGEAEGTEAFKKAYRMGLEA
jgi:multimeric flavodoxin WrbA